MSFMKCHHAHIPSNSPTPLHMHMPSVKIVTGITNDLCIEPSPTLLPNVSIHSPVNPDSYHTTRSLYHKHDRVSSLGNKTFRITPQVSYTHVPGFSPKGVNGPLLAPPNTPYLYFFYDLNGESFIGRRPKYELTTHSSTMMMGDDECLKHSYSTRVSPSF